MSNSTVPKVGGSDAITPHLSPPLKDGVLDLESFKGQEHRAKTRIVSIRGDCPAEEPFGYGLAIAYPDNRDLQPLTMRFMSKEAQTEFVGVNIQERVRIRVWSTLEELLRKEGCALPDDLPCITPNYSEVDDKPGYHGIIDLVFSSSKALEVSRRALKEIRLEDAGPQTHVYTCTRISNSVPKEIYVIDCLGLPLWDIDLDALFASAASMAAVIGSLVGIAKLVVDISDLNNETHQTESGLLRFYIKLDRQWMTAPLTDLAQVLPTHFQWYGSHHRLSYAGADLHTEVVVSADYP